MSSRYCDKVSICKQRRWCADDYDPKGACEFFEHETNADRIRAMSDEELAEFFFKDPFRMYMKTPKENLNWLKSPVEGTE